MKSYAEVELLHQSFMDGLLSRSLRNSNEELGLSSVRETTFNMNMNLVVNDSSID